mmetsp:Transcript_30706/g.86050  ORF Transcript_30706/g.86050 Transcript_30706/m.86050 type:complete len:594 (+) Transcript_30706:93-1874(+)
MDSKSVQSAQSLPARLLSFLFLAIASLFLTVTKPVRVAKKKLEDYNMAMEIGKGQDYRDLTFLQLALRSVKLAEKLPIQPGESFLATCDDIAGNIMGTDDKALIKKYWPFAPGLDFDQLNDGVSVQVKGDDFKCTLLSSLSYWGFHVNQEVMDYAIARTREIGVGNHGSYLLLGKNQAVQEAYTNLAALFRRKHCAISASGFLGCMNLVFYLAPKGGVIFIDEKAHICLRFGTKVSGAKVVRFPHNNYNALAKLVAQHRHKYTGRALLVLDGIYSADGTIANLPRAREICDEHNVTLVMDEAHSLGSMGPTGRGIEEHFNMIGACDFICGVFSKSVASYGGFVVSNNQEVLDLNASPGVGFASGPHAFSAASVAKAVEIIMRDGHKVRPAMEQLRWYFIGQMYRAGAANILAIGHDTFISFPHTLAATAVAIALRRRGEEGKSAWLISSFMFPSVPIHRSILRITISPLITRDIIDEFCLALKDVLDELAQTRFNDYIMHGEYEMPTHQTDTKYVGAIEEFNSYDAIRKVRELRRQGVLSEPEKSHTGDIYLAEYGLRATETGVAPIDDLAADNIKSAMVTEASTPLPREIAA